MKKFIIVHTYLVIFICESQTFPHPEKLINFRLKLLIFAAYISSNFLLPTTSKPP